MTPGDVYTTAGLMMLPVLAVLTAALVIDCWPEWAANHRARRVEFLAARRCRQPAAHFGPCDPSPVPRIIAAGIAQQDRDTRLRARAESDQQR